MPAFGRRAILLAFLLAVGLVRTAFADPAPASWDQALAQAEGETVYFNAWGGDPKINAYISWAAERVKGIEPSS